MNDNKEYWKELFGDDYNEELMDLLRSPSQPDDVAELAKTDQVNTPPDKDEGSLRYNNDSLPVAKNTVGESVSGQTKSGNGNEKKIKKEYNDDFDVTFDFDSEYRDVPDNRPVRQRREKRTGCLGGILYTVFVICLCLLLASLAWLAATDVLGLANSDTSAQITISEDFTVDSVADQLYSNGLIKYKFLFKIYADFTHADTKITVGTYALNDNYDYRALVNGMTTHGGKRVEVNVVIPEGNTLKQIFELFVANGVCTEAELWDVAANYDFEYDFLDKSTLGDKHRLEGYLFPDTYTFYVGDTATRAISKMLSNFKTKFTDEFKARAEELGYSTREIVIIASMIEKEAGADSDRDLIASVIYNRLKSSSFPHLQIDATILYAIAETGEAFSTEIDSPYNTYVQEKLPIGPISNPGIASIRAALFPQKTSYYYYALNKNGTHEFFKDGDSHLAFVNSDQYGG